MVDNSTNLAELFFGDTSAPVTPSEYVSISSQTAATSSPTDGTVSPNDMQLVRPSQQYDTSFEDALSFPITSHLATYPYPQHEEQRLFDQYLVHNPEVDGVQLGNRTGIQTSEAELFSDSFPSEQAPDAHFYDI
jgi:hypothetical protein